MSRIGKKPLDIPENVNILKVQQGNLLWRLGNPVHRPSPSSRPFAKRVFPKMRGQTVVVTGPKGTIARRLHKDLNAQALISSSGKTKLRIDKTQTQDTKQLREIHGLTRTMIENMITGVSLGFEKRLKLTGVGYRAQIDGNDLILNVGYSHPVKMITPEGVSVKVENPTTLLLSAMRKDLVGEFAAEIRSVRPPEPYKGKGIAYEDEIIRRKSGKTGK